MKTQKLYIINRNKVLIIMTLIIWCFFSFRMLTTQLKIAFKTYFKICTLSLEQKYRLIDGPFYDFMQFCKEKIPEGNSIIFKCVPRDPEFRTQEWFNAEYFLGRSPYYLYPRKVFREKDATPGIRYQMVYDTNAKTFGFYSQ